MKSTACRMTGGADTEIVRRVSEEALVSDSHRLPPVLYAQEKSPTPTRTATPVSERINLLAYAAAFVVAVVIPAILVCFGRDQGAWILVLAGVAGMLLTRLGDVESFVLGPLSAKLRNQIRKAEQATKEAEVTQERLRSLAAAIALPTLRSLRTLRVGSGPNLAQYSSKDEIVAQLRAVGAAPELIDEVCLDWLRGADMDHLDYVLDEIREAVTASGKTVDPQDDWPQTMRLRGLIAKGECFPLGDLTELADSWGGRTEKVSEAIKDFAHFLTNRALRRPTVFPGS